MIKSLDYLLSKNNGRYEFDGFLSFLKNVSFSYNVPSIHITGSNGKGTTASFIANIYKEAGYKVGLYISPYLSSPTEMIMINGESINDETFDEYFDKNRKAFEKFDLSEFEMETYIAFSYFKDQKCDIAVIECGMGAEYDATNIFTPILSIITSISLEHTSYLGRSISEVALQKAGIIKREVPVIIPNSLGEDALNVIREQASYYDALPCWKPRSDR